MLISTKVNKERGYIDLEYFFILSTKFLSDDLRLSRSMEYWCLSYGKYLSFKKINKILSKIDKSAYDGAIMGALLSIADAGFPKKGKFEKLSKYCKPKEEIEKLSRLFSNKKDGDQRWLNFGIIAPLFIPNEVSNNLCYKSHLVKYVPEIYFRMIGLPSAISDMKSILKFNKDISIYKLAKMAGLTYTTAFNHMKNLELLDIDLSKREFII